MINKVYLIGRLGRKPELKTSQNGMSYAFLNLAINSKKKDANGDFAEVTQWISVKVFNKTAENCSKYLDKGRQVAVEGKLSSYEKVLPDGKKSFKLDVIGDNVQFLGTGDKIDLRPKDNLEIDNNSMAKAAAVDFNTDDIPF